MKTDRVLRMGMVLMVSVALALGAWGVMPTFVVYAADSDIIVSEVMFNPFCESANGTNTGCEGGTTETQYEWVEIYNRGAVAVDIQNWQICDSAGCDTITTSSTLIGPGEYWIISSNSLALQSEMGPSGGNYGAYNAGRTLVLTHSIGSNGLSNTADAVSLRNGGGNATDCISWAAPAGTICSGLTYVPGGNGFDSTLAGESDGQSITNVQGNWYYHNANGNGFASPYGTNIASGGSPSAITLSTLSVTPSVTTWPIAAMLLMGMAVAAVWVWRRRR